MVQGAEEDFPARAQLVLAGACFLPREKVRVERNSTALAPTTTSTRLHQLCIPPQPGVLAAWTLPNLTSESIRCPSSRLTEI